MKKLKTFLYNIIYIPKDSKSYNYKYIILFSINLINFMLAFLEELYLIFKSIFSKVNSNVILCEFVIMIVSAILAVECVKKVEGQK